MALSDVVSAINNAQSQAYSASSGAISAATSYVADSIAYANIPNTIISGGGGSITSPDLADPLEVGDIPDTSATGSASYLTGFMDKFDEIMAQYFSDTSCFEVAEDLLDSILTNGYSVKTNIHDQIISRGKDSELLKVKQLRSEASIRQISRGFTFNSGVLNEQLDAINQDYTNNVSQLIRDVAIKEEDLNHDMTKLAIQSALDLRIRAIQVASEFVRGYAQMYNFGSDAAKAYIQGMSVVNDSIQSRDRNLVTIYLEKNQAVSRALDRTLKSQDMDFQQDFQKAKLKSDAAMSGADVLSRIGAAGLSAQTTIAQLGANTAA